MADVESRPEVEVADVGQKGLAVTGLGLGADSPPSEDLSFELDEESPTSSLSFFGVDFSSVLKESRVKMCF